MKEFALKHPYLTVFLIVPIAASATVHIVQAIRGAPKAKPEPSK